MPGSLPAARLMRGLNSVSRKLRKGPFLCAIMAQASIWPMRRGYLVYSSACTRRLIFQEQEWGWRQCSESLIDMGGKPGRQASPTRAQRSTSLCRIMMARQTLERRSGSAFGSFRDKSELQTQAHSRHITPMKGSWQVLIVEDSENDATLLELELQNAGYETICRRVETAAGVWSALAEQAWDVVIVDYVMPQFNGLAALAMIPEAGLDVPF